MEVIPIIFSDLTHIQGEIIYQRLGILVAIWEFCLPHIHKPVEERNNGSVICALKKVRSTEVVA